MSGLGWKANNYVFWGGAPYAMSFTDTENAPEFNLEALCLEAQNCQDDISPAELKLTPLCNPDITPYIITCQQQLNGISVQLMQGQQPRTDQCSNEPSGYVPSGRSAMIDISLSEGGVDSRLLEMVENDQWIISPYEGEADVPILAATDNAGACPILFKAELCPNVGSRDLVFPVAQLYTEEVNLEFNVTDQREFNFKIFARSDKRFGIRYYWRAKPNTTVDLTGGSLLSLPA